MIVVMVLPLHLLNDGLIVIIHLLFIVIFSLIILLLHHQSNALRHSPDYDNGLTPSSPSSIVPDEKNPKNIDKLEEQMMSFINSEMNRHQYFRDKDLTLQELAGKLGLTQSRIHKCLRKNGYVSLKHYLTARRINYVCELLRTRPFCTIDSISSDAGFKARKTFQTLFKEHMKMTPSQYRDLYHVIQIDEPHDD